MPAPHDERKLPNWWARKAKPKNTDMPLLPNRSAHMEDTGVTVALPVKPRRNIYIMIKGIVFGRSRKTMVMTALLVYWAANTFLKENFEHNHPLARPPSIVAIPYTENAPDAAS